LESNLDVQALLESNLDFQAFLGFSFENSVGYVGRKTWQKKKNTRFFSDEHQSISANHKLTKFFCLLLGLNMTGPKSYQGNLFQLKSWCHLVMNMIENHQTFLYVCFDLRKKGDDFQSVI